MSKISTKSKVLVAGIAGLTLGVSGVAYAYWTTTGAGSGSATNAGSNGTVTLSASWAAASLYPGGSQTVTFKAANPGATDLYVTSVHTVSFSADAGHPTCAVGDFSMPDQTENTTVPHGTALATPITLPNTGTISFANDAVNSQDGCKGAIITATLSSD